MDMDMLTLEVVDADGAIREAGDEIASETRSRFLQKALVAGGSFVAGGVLFGGFPRAALGRSQASDTEILNFALLLEYLEAEFYERAVRGGALSGETLRFARVVLAHEKTHVRFLRKALGSAARKKPQFDFKGTTEDAAKFRATAVVLEDTGVAAYNGQGANISSRSILAAAGSIVSVEARHAAWIRDIVNKNPAPAVLDPAKSKQQISRAVNNTGFISG